MSKKPTYYVAKGCVGSPHKSEGFDPDHVWNAVEVQDNRITTDHGFWPDLDEALDQFPEDVQPVIQHTQTICPDCQRLVVSNWNEDLE